jgi:hypothetical protein
VIVYVRGNLTADNFTPRPGKDTVGTPGQKPGLSASIAPPVDRKAQGIDLDLLAFPLKPFPDEVDKGGTEGHIAIAPADPDGEVDVRALEEWASFRGTGQTNPLTQALFDAVVRPNFRSNI